MKQARSRNCFLFIFMMLTGILSFGQETFLDNFNTTSYSNNNGSMNFSGDWVETNETTSPTAGRILINSSQLRFQNLDSRYITRSLDLSSAVSATLTLDYQRTNGNESILVQLFDGSSYNTRATLAGTGSVNYNLTAAEMSAASSIRFITGSGNWSSSETIFIDNVLFTATLSPTIGISDITVNENDGTATFTATHLGQNASGPFTVNYQTVDGTATAGSDYTAIVGGTLSFNGTVGDTESIVVSLTDDTSFENAETFTIQFTATSDPAVNISATATATINDNEIVLGNTPLTLFREFDGYMDYTSTAGTLRTQPNTVNSCSITTSSSNTLSSPIPAGATIDAAYLYWSHSGANMDSQVTFEGSTVNAEVAYTTSIIGLTFYGLFSDVTSLVSAIPNPSTNVYDFSGLTIDNTGSYCSSSVVLGGWSLMIFYSDTSLPASTINLYQGFDGNQNSSSTFTLNGFYAIGSVGSKTTALSWEGDQTLANNESLQFTTPLSGTNLLVGDGDNDGISANNPFNSTHFDNTTLPILNNTASHGVDLDTYDVSALILPGETSATTQVNVGQDYVIMNAVVLKVPSNLITGRVFEDVNYGGGAGRNYTAASGVGVSGATVELWDNVGTLIDTQTTDASGTYVFAGMVNGTYSVRVVNSSVDSSRPGGSACGSCLAVQTFKTEYIASSLVERPNEVGGANTAATDTTAGVLAGAQTLASVTINNEGVAGLDFGFNFNTIVNTNEDGQGSLEQFIVNANNIDETGLDIEANGIFDPAAGEDTSVFMIPPTGDVLGRAADANFGSGYFDISISNGSPLTSITGANTIIDGRTQTAYSGDTNSGTVGSGGTAVGTSSITLPNYSLPEIQLHRDGGDVLLLQGNAVTIRNVSVYGNSNAGIRIDSGSATITNNLLGVNALGANAGNIDYGVEMTGGTVVTDGNYIATNTAAGIRINGGTSTVIQNNHLAANGNTACDDNITIDAGSGIVIQQNLIETAASLGIDGDGISGAVVISENTITTSGQDGGSCSGNIENAGILLDGSNSSISNNIIFSNGGAGIVLAGGSTSGNLISQNAIYANGTASDALGIDLDPTDNIGDGVTLNDNGDADSGPNGAVNFPIISGAYISGSNLVLKGWARPGATIEFFLTDIQQGTATLGDNQLGMTTDYGEGQTYIGTAVEGSGSDLDAGSSVYTDLDGNTDNTNQFEFSIALAPGVSLGNHLTATATLANTTSEFSPFSIIKIRTIITNRRITYRVNN
ncbi:beta strand repeat-containing protein [Muriicola sp. Z0-33]|uniref:beta strand repeat-containing protein n=1 Tax=Muriicola sp. Z0-33 TaxID=2816957 RepID=UPI002237116D|nr:Calx-beta domain-containing protein [Muriicola sp. Z0-33]MCW5518078.1 right-handed parallel beta-helix repeat-containing protein [Muriicola sp. Z0-33]